MAGSLSVDLRSDLSVAKVLRDHPGLEPELVRINDDLVSSGDSSGLLGYLTRARKLLADSRAGINPLERSTISVPLGHIFEGAKGREFWDYVHLGSSELSRVGYVLVAGGLGERLGYPGIKLEIPIESVHRMSYLEFYVRSIKAALTSRKSGAADDGTEFLDAAESLDTTKSLATELLEGNSSSDSSSKSTPGQNQSCQGHSLDWIPLAIMTSEDTHDATVRLIAELRTKTLDPVYDSIVLMKQKKVPALSDNDANLSLFEGAVSPSRAARSEAPGPIKESRKADFHIETKPHGHGDVHGLLLASGVIDQWTARGVNWLYFLQDTNAVSFRPLELALGVSVRNNLVMNILAVPRMIGEAAGAISKVETISMSGEKTTRVCNVEYNVFGRLVQETASTTSSAVSQYPGNTNMLLFRLPEYHSVLKQSGGVVPEFVNPKYADSARTTFKSATRLECLMQDFALLLAPEVVGYTRVPRYLGYSCLKNSSIDAAAKQVQLGHVKTDAMGKKVYAGWSEEAWLRQIGEDIPPSIDSSRCSVSGADAHLLLSGYDCPLSAELESFSNNRRLLADLISHLGTELRLPEQCVVVTFSGTVFPMSFPLIYIAPEIQAVLSKLNSSGSLNALFTEIANAIFMRGPHAKWLGTVLTIRLNEQGHFKVDCSEHHFEASSTLPASELTKYEVAKGFVVTPI